METNNKTEWIKIRISKSEKEQLQKIAADNHTTLSAYILQKSLCTDDIQQSSLPEAIESLNLANEIYHEISKCNDERLKTKIKNIIERGKKN